MTASIDFTAPARTWLECLPLGNGTLGAMLDGGVPITRIRLNDETAWSGSPDSELAEGVIDPDAARRQLEAARSAVAAGDPLAAAAALLPMQVPYTQAFLPFATLVLTRDGGDAPHRDRGDAPHRDSGDAPHRDSGDAPHRDRGGADGSYRRSLDLETAVHEARIGRLRERTFVSAVHGVLVHRIEGTAALDLAFETPHEVIDRGRRHGLETLLIRLPSDVAPGHEPDRPGATWSKAPGAALEGAVVVGIAEDGGGTLVVAATETTFARPGANAATDGLDASERAGARVRAALGLGWSALLEAHLDDWMPRFGRARIALGDGPSDESGAPLETSERLERAASAPDGPLAADPALVALLFDLGRYLLLSSSRPGSLPATLQGIWNDELRPPWSSNYTLNINTEMNYWAAHSTALDECAEPLWDFLAALAVRGGETARRLYGARGWVAHHNSDAWALTNPVGAHHGDAKWTAWPLAGPWLVIHIAEAVAFGAIDDARLRTLWPALRGVAEFALDWLRPGADGRWITSPATSPENAYLTADDIPAAIDVTTTMDLTLLRAALLTTVVVGERLGIDDDVVVRARERASELPAEPDVGSDGAIIEFAEERPLEDEHHRHVSHLVGLYPGVEPWSATAREAAAVSLTRRGDESSGWSLVWKALLWARLGRGDRVAAVVGLLLRDAESVTGEWAGGLYPNLFAAHPPFQIDANLAFPALLAETILQSHDGLHLLPALPPALSSGSAAGLIARPGVVVDIEWRNGALVRATLTGRAGRAVPGIRVRCGGSELFRDIPSDTTVELSAADFEAES